MTRFRLSLGAALAVAGLAWAGLARAGDDVAGGAPAAPAPAAAEAPKAAPETPATSTPSPIHSMMGWVAKQVAPGLDCPCPGTADGETAWRAWFDGGKDVPLASLRDAMVADGWTADRTVAFFKDMQAKMSKGDCSGPCADKAKAGGACAKGEGSCSKADGACAKGDGACAKSDGATAKADDGCCKGKAERTDGKPCCGGCKKDKPADAPKPEEAPAKP
jgi:hypothetical protein